MPSREEIRDEAERLLQELHDIPPQQSHAILDDLFRQLHSQGVVIKVDRELPQLKSGMFPQIGASTSDGYRTGIEDMTKAGYVAVEPLIEKPMKYATARIYDIDKSGKEVSNGKGLSQGV